MDKPGPHGGIIQMPGAYHLEALKKTKETIQIYVLDMNFVNKTPNEKTEITAQVRRKKQNLKLQCEMEPAKEFYLCQSPQKIKAEDVLLVDSKLGDMKGNQAQFEFEPKAKGK
jgi:predicted double-glycine peptidase